MFPIGLYGKKQEYQFREQQTLLNAAQLYYRRVVNKPISAVVRANVNRRVSRSPVTTTRSRNGMVQAGVEFATARDDSTRSNRFNSNANIRWERGDQVEKLGVTGGVFFEHQTRPTRLTRFLYGYQGRSDAFREMDHDRFSLMNRLFAETGIQSNARLSGRLRITASDQIGNIRIRSLETRLDLDSRGMAGLYYSSGIIWNQAVLPEPSSLLRWVNSAHYRLSRSLRWWAQSNWAWNPKLLQETAWVESGVSWKLRRLMFKLVYRDDIRNHTHHHSGQLMATRALGGR